jgi:hypothetical protein
VEHARKELFHDWYVLYARWASSLAARSFLEKPMNTIFAVVVFAVPCR